MTRIFSPNDPHILALTFLYIFLILPHVTFRYGPSLEARPLRYTLSVIALCSPAPSFVGVLRGRSAGPPFLSSQILSLKHPY